MKSFMHLCRVGSIFVMEIAGSRTFGKERPMVKGEYTPKVVVHILATSKMVGEMDTACT